MAASLARVIAQQQFRLLVRDQRVAVLGIALYRFGKSVPSPL